MSVTEFTRKGALSRNKKKNVTAFLILERPLPLTISLPMSAKPLEIKLKSAGFLF